MLLVIYLTCLCHIYIQEEETVWCLEEALMIVVWIICYVGTNMLDESDSTHWKNQLTLLFDVSLDPCNISVFLTPQSYPLKVWDNHFLWSILNSRNKLKHFYGNTLVWQWHTTSWNESFKSLAGVEKSITGFWDGGSYRKVFGKWKDCWRSGFADTVLVCLCEVLGGCDNSSSPLPGNANSLATFCGLLLDCPFLFWVAFVFFFPQFSSRLAFAEFISACSVVDFAFSFEMSVLSTFNLLVIATVWQHTLNDLYRKHDLLRHVTTCPFTRMSYSTGTGILMFFLLWQ